MINIFFKVHKETTMVLGFPRKSYQEKYITPVILLFDKDNADKIEILSNKIHMFYKKTLTANNTHNSKSSDGCALV